MTGAVRRRLGSCTGPGHDMSAGPLQDQVAERRRPRDDRDAAAADRRRAVVLPEFGVRVRPARSVLLHASQRASRCLFMTPRWGPFSREARSNARPMPRVGKSQCQLPELIPRTAGGWRCCGAIAGRAARLPGRGRRCATCSWASRAPTSTSRSRATCAPLAEALGGELDRARALPDGDGSASATWRSTSRARGPRPTRIRARCPRSSPAAIDEDLRPPGLHDQRDGGAAARASRRADRPARRARRPPRRPAARPARAAHSSDDPTRALRAARYAARFELRARAGDREAAAQADLSTVSEDRVQAELRRDRRRGGPGARPSG